MECNKDEAMWAKAIAEAKLIDKEIFGAQKYASKAQNLFPTLEGLSQFVETLNIYASAEKRINGEIDWYRILGVDPAADEETIMKSYLKLTLNLHPDTNKSVGSEGAFKIISEAWSCLSDKTRRQAYDQIRNAQVTSQKIDMPNFSTSAGRNDFNSFSPDFSSSTFWTLCSGCDISYKYTREYVNLKLLCPNCHDPFWAMEMPMPPSHCQNANYDSAGVRAATSTAVQHIPNFIPGIKGKGDPLKRRLEGALLPKGKAAVTGLDYAKKQKMEEHEWTGYRRETKRKMAMGPDFSQSELRGILMEKARAEIRKYHLETWNLLKGKEMKENEPRAAKREWKIPNEEMFPVSHQVWKEAESS